MISRLETQFWQFTATKISRNYLNCRTFFQVCFYLSASCHFHPSLLKGIGDGLLFRFWHSCLFKSGWLQICCLICNLRPTPKANPHTSKCNTFIWKHFPISFLPYNSYNNFKFEFILSQVIAQFKLTYLSNMSSGSVNR